MCRNRFESHTIHNIIRNNFQRDDFSISIVFNRAKFEQFAVVDGIQVSSGEEGEGKRGGGGGRGGEEERRGGGGMGEGKKGEGGGGNKREEKQR